MYLFSAWHRLDIHHGHLFQYSNNCDGDDDDDGGSYGDDDDDDDDDDDGGGGDGPVRISSRILLSLDWSSRSVLTNVKHHEIRIND